jgi:hypothetical protein
MKKKAYGFIVFVALFVVACLFLGMQLVHPSILGTNPPVVAQPTWPDAQTEALARGACFDCHSNETTWYWYTQIAPVSWLVANDVAEGRSRLNFSEWGQGGQEVDELAGVVLEGEMPPGIYQIMHASARLTAEQRQALATGFQSLR